jgi:hypothetical protein
MENVEAFESFNPNMVPDRNRNVLHYQHCVLFSAGGYHSSGLFVYKYRDISGFMLLNCDLLFYFLFTHIINFLFAR